MAAVELTIFMGVLAIFSVLAYVLILRRMKTKHPNQADIAAHTEPKNEEVKADYSKILERQEPKKPSRKKPAPKCKYYFGYLSNIPKNSKPPSECLQCSKKTRCINGKKPRKASALKQIDY